MTNETPSAAQNGFATTPVTLEDVAGISQHQPLDVDGLKMKHVESIDDEAFIVGWNDCIDHLNKQGYLSDPSEVARLREENKRLRDACEWYASDEAWTTRQVESCDGDYGRRAKAALAAGKDGE